MNPRRKKRLIAVTSVVVLFAAATTVMLFSLSGSIDVFYTPTEIHEGKESTGQIPTVGQRIRIGGLVVPGSVVRDGSSLSVRFDLMDTGPKVTVEFNGILPDLFREGQGIVATGVLQTPTLVVAQEVLAKHDEEYMPPELAEQLKDMGHLKNEKGAY
ncbi:MAG: cytochrome c maturation protein CcmE [Pseudomonadota bacterium]